MKSAILLTLLCLSALSLAALPGAKVTLRPSAFDEINTLAMPIVLDIIANTQLPDINLVADVAVIGKVDVDVTGLQITKNVTFVKTAITIVNGGIQFNGAGLTGTIIGDYHYKQHNWPHTSGSGKFDASFSQSDIVALVKLVPGSDGKPVVTLSGKLTLRNFNLHMHGSILDWVMNLFIKIIKPKLVSTIESTVADTIASMSATVNDLVGLVPLPFPIQAPIPFHPLELDLDWSLLQIACVTSSATFGSKAVVTIPDDTYDIEPVAIPDSINSDEFNLIVSKATIQSVFHAMYDSKVFTYTYTNVSTDDYKYALPALYKAFPHTPMKLELQPKEEPSVVISGDSLFFVASAEAVASVLTKNGPVLAFEAHGDLTLRMSMQFTGFNKTALTAKITTLTLKIASGSSPYGSLDFKLIDFALKYVLEAVRAVINVELEDGIEIPAYSGLKLIDGQIVSGDDWFGIGMDIVAA